MMMDGTGQEQDLGQPTGSAAPDAHPVDGAPATLENGDTGGGAREDESELGGGRLGTADGKQAVRNQSVVSPDDYSGSSESGV